MQDLEDGLISHRVARDVYCIAYDAQSLMVNQEETIRMREEKREERKKNGMPFSEFEKQWQALKPDEDILEFYGDWPDTHYSSFSYFGEWDK